MTGVNNQLPALLEDCDDDAEVLESFADLCDAANEQSPALCSCWDGGVAALLRIAAAAPRRTWLRSPSERWAPEEPQEERLRRLLLEGDAGADASDPLAALDALVRHLLCKHHDAALGAPAGGFTWSDGGGVAYQDRSGAAIVLCSFPALRLGMRFARLAAAVGQGESPVDAAKKYLTPALTKKMVRAFMAGPGADHVPPPPLLEVPDNLHFAQPDSVRLLSPLGRLRAAQVAALGGPAHVARAAVLGTRLGVDLAPPEVEEFAISVLEWACRFADAPELQDVDVAGRAMDWLLAERVADAGFSLTLHGNPRSPKKVAAAAERARASLELQRLQTTGELFDPNPTGIKGFLRRNVSAAFDPGCSVAMSERRPPNSWNGDRYQPCEEEELLLKDPDARRMATVRVEEILSFEYLQYVGRTLQNCLQAQRRGGSSLFKYLSRARARDSSFWVMTITADDQEEEGGSRDVEHLLLVEVYNRLRVIHQAEGPHPRRWPRADAWAWLKEWAQEQGLRPDGPEGVTVGPGGYEDWDGNDNVDPWDIRGCFLW